MAEPNAPWAMRVQLLVGAAMAVLTLAGALWAIAAKPFTYFSTRDEATAQISRDVATAVIKLGQLSEAVRANHEATERDIGGVQQSQRDAIRARDGQVAHINDKIEAIETDVGRIEGQIGYNMKNPRR